MLNILQDLEDAESKFVSLADIVEAIVHVSKPKPNYIAAANWLLMEFKKIDNAGNLPQLVMLNRFYELVSPTSWGYEPDIDIIDSILSIVQQHNCLPYTHPDSSSQGGYYENNSMIELGFEKSLMKPLLPQVVFDWIDGNVLVDAFESHSTRDPLDTFSENEGVNKADTTPCDTKDFRGRAVLIEIIAGLSIALGASNKKYTRKTGLNKQGIARDISDFLSDFGHGLSIDVEHCRKTIAEALLEKADIDVDYLNLNGEREFSNQNITYR